MNKVLIKICLISFLFCFTLVKDVLADNYIKNDAYAYYSDQAAKCREDNKVVSIKNTAIVLPGGDCGFDDLSNPYVCTTFQNEVGCFSYQHVNQPSVSQPEVTHLSLLSNLK